MKTPRKPRPSDSGARTRARARAAENKQNALTVRAPGWLFPGERTATEQRIEEIAAMMLAGEWWPGRSHRELAERWGLTTSRARELASEAHRHVRQLAADTPEMREAVLGKVHALYERCLSATRVELRKGPRGARSLVEVPAPDLGNALKALELAAKLAGLLTNKVEVTTRDPFEGWSDEEKRHFAETGEMPERGRLGA